MKFFFGLLVLSTAVVLVAAVAMWWRLRRDLRSSNGALKEVLGEIQSEHEPEHESVER